MPPSSSVLSVSPPPLDPDAAAPAVSFRIVLVLGLLTAVGPFAIDMYLPALPAIGQSLAAGPTLVQASLMAYLLAAGLGQLVSGPISDMRGRRAPLLAGLGIFLLGSIACAVAPTIGTLIAGRVLQGLGACFVMVIPRAVVRDLHTGPQAARLMGTMMMIYSVSPIVAPVAGSLITEQVGWRGVFAVIAGLSVLALLLARFGLPETRPAAARQQASLRTAFANYRALLGDRHFLGLAFMMSFSLAGFFIYVANSPFAIGTHFHLSPRVYALLFALNAITFVIFSQMSGRLARRLGLRRLVRWAVIAKLVMALVMIGLTLARPDSLVMLTVSLAALFGMVGIIMPASMVLAMETHPERAGTASALIGTFNFAGGALAAALVAPFADGTPLPMAAGIAVCSVAIFTIAMNTLRAPIKAAGSSRAG